ncbi:MAG: hypothetical protein AVDCRST_MAG05-3230, partial [uncultured Rubrobacteraceae bacterium]
ERTPRDARPPGPLRDGGSRPLGGPGGRRTPRRLPLLQGGSRNPAARPRAPAGVRRPLGRPAPAPERARRRRHATPRPPARPILGCRGRRRPVPGARPGLRPLASRGRGGCCRHPGADGRRARRRRRGERPGCRREPGGQRGRLGPPEVRARGVLRALVCRGERGARQRRQLHRRRERRRGAGPDRPAVRHLLPAHRRDRREGQGPASQRRDDDGRRVARVL